MDESQTGITLDGIPLGAPGAATDLRRINTDLFAGASTSFGPQAGSLAGTVNFRTLQPTQTWQSRLSTSYGTFDRFNYQIAKPDRSGTSVSRCCTRTAEQLAANLPILLGYERPDVPARRRIRQPRRLPQAALRLGEKTT